MKRNSKGFTLAEVLLVVALLGILGSVVTVNVIEQKKSMDQQQMDDIAQELFFAAQNHLTMAAGQGYYGLTPGTAESRQAEGGAEETIAYYVVHAASGDVSDTVLKMLLPVASVDESVRMGGSYILRYRTEPAQMLDVFYMEGAKFPANVDLAELCEQYAGQMNKGRRMRYPTPDKEVPLGWYGVEANGLAPVIKPEVTLEAPSITVVNAERLEVRITNPNNSAEYTTSSLKLELRGETSGHTYPLIVFNNKGEAYSGDAANAYRMPQFTVVLDDVTAQAGHFYRFCMPSVLTENRLIPGENITVCAVAYDNTRLSNIARSNEVLTNSLFASCQAQEVEKTEDESESPDSEEEEKKEKEDAASVQVSAAIANFRHLENLDPAISGLGIHDKEAGALIGVAEAKQTGNMDWDVFLETVSNGADSVRVFPCGDGRSASGAGCFLPVNPAGALRRYDGGSSVIRGVKVDTGEDAAGLFGTLKDVAVSDLELLNISVRTSGGAAGALAGVVQGESSVARVIARHDGRDCPVSGETAAGGLIGVLGGGEVTRCAAALPVEAKSGSAGGLLGSSAGKVTQSYAGGMTENGAYNAGNANVTARDAAGGLIGSMSGGSVDCCYSTCSARGGTAGGLLGSASSGSVSKSYCTGLVTAASDGAEGAFAGTAGASFSGCGYFGIINRRTTGDAQGEYRELGPVGGAPAPLSGKEDEASYTYKNTDLWPMDYDLDTYESWFPYEAEAQPYDTFLRACRFYPLQTISRLADIGTAVSESEGDDLETGEPADAQPQTASELPDWLSRHYGDWPVAELEAVND